MAQTTGTGTTVLCGPKNIEDLSYMIHDIYTEAFVQ